MVRLLHEATWLCPWRTWHQDASPFPAEPVTAAAIPCSLISGSDSPSDAGYGTTAPIRHSAPGSIEHIKEPIAFFLAGTQSQAMGYIPLISSPSKPGRAIDRLASRHGAWFAAHVSDRPRIAVASVYHARAEEDELRREHRQGAIRKPQLVMARPSVLSRSITRPRSTAVNYNHSFNKACLRRVSRPYNTRPHQTTNQQRQQVRTP